MNRRLLVALGLVAVLAGLAGCASILGSGQPDDAKLAENASYDWDTDAKTTYNVSRSQFTSIIVVDNRTSLVVYELDELGTDEPLDLRALQFRYPNGTVINASSDGLDARNEGQRTNITFPQENGTVAFTAPRPNAKRFSTPLFVEGSHEVVLPPQARVGIPLLSKVSPSSDSRDVTDGRMTVHWNNVDRGPIVVRYYLQRDILLFGGVGGILAVVGIVGGLYYFRQLRVIQRKREDFDIDIDMDDDEFDDDGPPPGMR